MKTTQLTYIDNDKSQDMTPIKIMGTISESSKAFGVTEYALRKWIHNGDLPAVKIGKKFLINFAVLEKFLKGESLNAPAQNDNVYKIKPIGVRGIV